MLGLAVCLFAIPGTVRGQTAYTWNGTTNTTFGTTTNWTSGSVAPTGGTSDSRINVNNTDPLRPLTYTGSQGTTIYSGGAGRALVIASSFNGNMVITGGTFDSRQTAEDVMVNGQHVGSLTINGGSYINTNGGSNVFIAGFNAGALPGAAATLNVQAGSFTTGILQIGQTGGIGAGGLVSTINLDGGTLTTNLIREQGIAGTDSALIASTINFNGGTLRAGATDSSFLLTGSVDNAVVLAGGAVIDTNTFDITVSKALTAGLGSGGLTKNGVGTLTLNGTNTYTGTTTISGGTLALGSAGLINSTSGVVLATGTLDVSAKGIGGYSTGNLSGNGDVVGSLTVTNQLSIGSSPGTIDFESLSLGGSSTFLYEVTGGGSTADLGNVSGTLNLGSSTLNMVQLGTYTLGDKFTLFGYNSGNLIGTFSGLPNGTTFTNAGGDWQINYADATPGLNGGTGNLFVTVMAVPEPATLVLLAAGAGVVGLGVTRRFGRRRTAARP